MNFPAHFVIVKGTEFYDGKLKRYVDMPITDVLQMMGRAGRPQYDNMGIALIMVYNIKKKLPSCSYNILIYNYRFMILKKLFIKNFCTNLSQLNHRY